MGKAQLLNRLFALGASPIIALAVGSSNTAAAATDTHLGSENLNTGGGDTYTVRPTLTNTAGASLSSGDIVDDPQTISGIFYQKKIIVRGKFLTTDLPGDTFYEYGLFDTTTLPGSPTGVSGTMFNHVVVGTPITKTLSIEVDCDTTIRF